MFLKTVIPLLFLLRDISKPSDAVIYDEIRGVYGPKGIYTLNNQLNNSKKLLEMRIARRFTRCMTGQHLVGKFTVLILSTECSLKKLDRMFSAYMFLKITHQFGFKAAIWASKRFFSRMHQMMS